MGISGALLLAGGPAGSNMEILCSGRSRPGLPFGGRLKVMDFAFSNCFNSGIPHIAVITDRNSRGMWSYLRQWHLAGKDKHDIQVLEPETDTYRGTADALYRNMDFIEKLEGDTVLVISADKVYRMDYRAMALEHERSGAAATAAVVRTGSSDDTSETVFEINDRGRISGCAKKNLHTAAGAAPMGCYLFSRDALLEYLKRDAAIRSSAHSIKQDLLPAITRHNHVRAYPFEGYWRDIRSVLNYYGANLDCIHEMLPPLLDRTAPVRNPLSSNPGLSPVNSHNIKQSIIGRDCVIEGYVENSVISPGVHISRHAEVWDSIVMAGVTVGGYSIIDHCIIDENSSIGYQCYLGLGANFDPGRTNLTVIGKRVKVPSCTSIGRNCRVFPFSGPDDFPGNVVPAGSTVSPDIKRKNAVTG